jgi:cation transport ATPase
VDFRLWIAQQKPLTPPPDWKRVASRANKADAISKHLFNWSAGAITVLITVATTLTAFFVGRTLSDVRSLTDSEVQRMRVTVRERVEAKFQTEKVRETVR